MKLIRPLNALGDIVENKRERCISGEIKTMFNLTTLPSGLYFVRIKTERGDTWFEKLPINWIKIETSS